MMQHTYYQGFGPSDFRLMFFHISQVDSTTGLSFKLNCEKSHAYATYTSVHKHIRLLLWKTGVTLHHIVTEKVIPRISGDCFV